MTETKIKTINHGTHRIHGKYKGIKMDGTQTNHKSIIETWKHIDEVCSLLIMIQSELMGRMLSHDKSKLVYPEVDTFSIFTEQLSKTTYGSDEYKKILNQMRPALEHHYENNRHHPEHFENGIEEMTLVDIIEMVCDWLAATNRHNDGDIWKSIDIQTKKLNLSPQVVSIIKNTVESLIGGR